MKFLTLFLLTILIIPFNSIAQDSKKDEKNIGREAQYNEVLKIIDAESYEFTGRRANPQGGRQIDLTTRPNFLRVKNGTASADMPYFGRAFSGGYSSTDGGIKFEGPMETYDVQKNDKKRRVIVKFKVRGTDDTYSCTLMISGKEGATLSITSNKRQVISYTGTIRELEDE